MLILKTSLVRGFSFLLLLSLANFSVFAQRTDSIPDEIFSVHAQTTVVSQNKASFNVKYTEPNANSLSPQQESAPSITSTLFLGTTLWKGASLFINPEIAGGAGLSGVLGVADATNGETFRISDEAPELYLARLFFQQIFPLTKETAYQETDINQLGQHLPTKYFSVAVGKISITDFFDDNKYSHDPRTQFLCWGLMDNGAWDYPANTRGYTPSIVLQYVTPKYEWHYGVSILPLTANGNNMNWNVFQASGHTLEYTHYHKIKYRAGAIRVLAYLNTANMGNYLQSIALSPQDPNIENTRKYGNVKYGFGLNAEQELTKNLGGFFRASWDDGHTETWAFTEIDRSVSAGLSLTGQSWKRAGDNVGFAMVASGISKPHREYLADGGKGFMLGDGKLNYALEYLSELYYSAELVKNQIYLTGTYQFLLNPGYNKDRQGPVNIFSIRVHYKI